VADAPEEAGKTRARRITALCLCALGVAGAFYGYAFHRQAVLIEREVEQSETPADAVGAPPDMPDIPIYDQEGNLVELPPLPPEEEIPAPAQEVLETFLEHVLVRDVTVGGIDRIGDGSLKRTYTGKPPQQCPT